jgi:hypothetical protein
MGSPAAEEAEGKSGGWRAGELRVSLPSFYDTLPRRVQLQLDLERFGGGSFLRTPFFVLTSTAVSLVLALTSSNPARAL